MLTQLTYEGLIDELIGIKNCKASFSLLAGYFLTSDRIAYVEVPASLLAQPSAPNASQAGSSAAGPSSAPLSSEKKKKHHLTAANDILFAEIRDLNFSAVPRKLSKAAHRLDEEYKVSLSYDPDIWAVAYGVFDAIRNKIGFRARVSPRLKSLWGG